MIPELIIPDHVHNVLMRAREFAVNNSNDVLMNWIKHKDANPWILTWVIFPLSKMGRSD